MNLLRHTLCVLAVLAAIVLSGGISPSNDIYAIAAASARSEAKRIAHAHPKAVALLNKLTLTEKVYMLTGVFVTTLSTCTGLILPNPRVDFKGICHRNGGAGPSANPLLTPNDKVSAYPGAVTMGATWDADLVEAASKAMGKEFRLKGSNIILGPVVGGPMGRSAFDGRVYENYGNDPVLTGAMAFAAVRGLQAEHVQVCAKHFMGYEQETWRGVSRVFGEGASGFYEPIDSHIDDRTTHELYMWGFAEAVRADVASIMCSYNRVNGSHACENSYTLNHLLKEELNFQGNVVSDWGAVWNPRLSINNGMDVDMPGIVDNIFSIADVGNVEALLPTKDHIHFGPNLYEDVKKGHVSESRLDDAVLRVLTPYYRLQQDEYIPEWWTLSVVNTDAAAGHESIIRRVCNNAATLLKNVRNHDEYHSGSSPTNPSSAAASYGLPLPATARLAVFGDDAGHPTGDTADETHGTNCASSEQCAEDAKRNGTLYSDGGSGAAASTKISFPIDALKQRVKRLRATHSRGDQGQEPAIHSNLNPHLYRDPATIRKMAQSAETALVFVALRGTEGKDMPTLHADANGDALVQAVASQFANTIVVVHTGNPIVISRWNNHPNVTAIINSHLPGGESGRSITELLYGDVTPAGKLPYTMAKNEDDYIRPVTAHMGGDPKSYFTEGLLLDYRRFEARGMEPLYEFGFGLSYTNFSYGPLVVQQNNVSSSPSSPNAGAGIKSADPSLYYTVVTLAVNITNSGKYYKGSEAVQVYVAYPPSAGEPPKVLRGFTKVHDLQPGETQVATIPLKRKSFSIWDVPTQSWVVPSGQYTVMAAASSRDVRQSATITVG